MRRLATGRPVQEPARSGGGLPFAVLHRVTPRRPQWHMANSRPVSKHAMHARTPATTARPPACRNKTPNPWRAASRWISTVLRPVAWRRPTWLAEVNSRVTFARFARMSATRVAPSAKGIPWNTARRAPKPAAAARRNADAWYRKDLQKAPRLVQACATVTEVCPAAEAGLTFAGPG